jgi:uncharacterized protein
MEWQIQVNDRATRAVLDPATAAAPGGRRTVFVCAHGAGGNMSDRSLLAAARAMRAVGMDVVRFNFFYKEKGSGRPDPMPLLQSCTRAVVDRVRAEVAPDRLIIGGRSMGGRAASMLTAEGFDCDGLLLLAYPLHPAGQPEKLRDAHLRSISVPVLALSGTRDDLCRRELMERVLTTVQTDWSMHWLEGADHSFHVLKASGRTDAEVLAEAGEAARAWLATLP